MGKDLNILNLNKLDYQVSLYRNNSTYVVFGKAGNKYAIGIVACGFYRVIEFPDYIEEIIKDSIGDNKDISEKNIKRILDTIKAKIGEKYGMIYGCMITAHLKASLDEFIQYANDKDNYKDFLLEDGKRHENTVFEGTEYEGIGCEDAYQLILTAYLKAYDDICCYKRRFDIVMTMLSNGKKNSSFKGFFDFMEEPIYQKIDYKIKYVNGKLCGIYSFCNPLSLLCFEVHNILNSGTIIRRCHNCGKYFPVTGRSDTMYCPYESEDYGGKSCRQIGALKVRERRINSNQFEKEYQKLRSRISMQSRRHPDDTQLDKKLRQYIDEGGNWRRKIEDDSSNEIFALEWLKDRKKELLGDKASIFTPDEVLSRAKERVGIGKEFKVRDVFDEKEWDSLSRGERMSLGRSFYNDIVLDNSNDVVLVENTGRNGVVARYKLLMNENNNRG